MTQPLISIVTACYNEEQNVRPLHEAVKAVMAKHPQYRFEHIFADNCSQDGTRAALRALCAEEPNARAIFNARNFGVIRSGTNALHAARGDAVIGMAADFQEPPEMIHEFLRHWEAGAKVVLAQKTSSSESGLFFRLRGLYYRLLDRIADVRIEQQVTGFGLFDRKVMDALKRMNDPLPFMRGLIAEIGYAPVLVPFHQPPRAHGVSTQNFYSLYETAMLGIIGHSRVPLQLATMLGFAMSVLSLLVALGYLIAKLLFWNAMPLGVAPILIGFFCLTSVQLFFIGIVGEYVGTIWTHVRHVPYVFETERINFD